MKESNERILAFFGMHLVYFPLLILIMHGWSWGHARFGLNLSETIYNLLHCLLAAGLYVGLGYVVALVMNRRHPGSTPQPVPDPTRSGRYARR